jgi:hypothetical protein
MRLVWQKWNRILFWLAVIMIAVGYIIMSAGDRTISPFILIISYLVLVPLALLFNPKKKEPRE